MKIIDRTALVKRATEQVKAARSMERPTIRKPMATRTLSQKASRIYSQHKYDGLRVAK